MNYYKPCLLAIALIPGLTLAQDKLPLPGGEFSVDAITVETLIAKPKEAIEIKAPGSGEKSTADQISNKKSIGYVPGEPVKTQPSHSTYSKVDRLYTQAIRLKSTEPKAAISQLKNVLSINPAHDKARLKLARLLVTRSQPQQAMQWLKPLVSADNPDWQPWFWMGTAALQAGDQSVAGAMLDQALIREKSESAIWVQRAVVEQEKGAYETALQLLNTAVSLSPEDPVIMLNIAYSASAIGHLQRSSEAYYKKYLDLLREDSGE